MNKTLFLILSITAISVSATASMDLTVGQHIPTDTIEKEVVIVIENQEKKLLARYLSLFGLFKNLKADLPKSDDERIPLEKVSLATWQRIEPRLEQVYAITQGNQQAKSEVLAEYRQFDSINLIDLIRAAEYLDIPSLREITFEIAQSKLSLEEICTLSGDIRNEVIKRKAFMIAGPVALKGQEVCESRDGVLPVCVTTDNMIVSCSKKHIQIWTMVGNPFAVCEGHEEDVLSVCIASDNRIVSGSGDHTVRIWDISGKQLVVCEGHEGGVWVVCVTSDNKIVSGSDDHTVRVWNMLGKQLSVCEGHEKRVGLLIVTSDNKIVSGSDDYTIRVWHISGTPLAICRGHKDKVTSICVTDNRIVSGSEDTTVGIWDMEGTQLVICRGHRSGVISLCVTLDNRIVSGSKDATVRIWTMAGNPLAVYKGHEGYINSVCATLDNRIISGSGDHAVQVWDMNGVQLAVCEDQERMVFSVSVTSDNKRIISSSDRTVWIWDRRDIVLTDRLSSMSEKQVILIDGVLERYKILLFELKKGLRKFKEDSLYYLEFVAAKADRGLGEGIEVTTIKACSIISEQCWQEIEKILEGEEEAIVDQHKKRKEIEDGDSNPAKKERLMKEELIVTENKE
jgi:WD40 repeat protein